MEHGESASVDALGRRHHREGPRARRADRRARVAEQASPIRLRRRGALPPALPFLAPDELDSSPNIAVDGSPSRHTVLTLSHWPASPTPAELARDTSVQIVFAYLERPHWWAGDAVAVTDDHLDQDGVVAAYCLVDPEGATARRSFLEQVAEAGDFAKFADRRAGRVAFALGRLDETLADEAPALGPRVRAILDRLPDLCDATEDHEDLWGAEDEAYARSEECFESGVATIEEHPDADLVVVRIAGAAVDGMVTRPDIAAALPIHPAAVHRRTGAMHVLVLHDHRPYLYQRYETWVKYVSRRLRQRSDLTSLAVRLSAAETTGVQWRADPPAAIEPSLWPAATDDLDPASRCENRAETSLDDDRLVAIVKEHLTSAPAAWDPFSARGGYA